MKNFKPIKRKELMSLVQVQLIRFNSNIKVKLLPDLLSAKTFQNFQGYNQNAIDVD
jgi:hypothetical protein